MSVDRVKTFLKLYYNKYSSVPSQKMISTNLNISLEEVTRALMQLKKDGFIQSKTKGYFIPDINAFEKEDKTIKTKVKKLQIGFRDFLTIDNFIRVIMFLIACSAMVISVYYTQFWLISYLSNFYATLLSSIMVIYASFSFHGVLVIENRGVKVFIVITAVIVIFFSMFSTIAGQYNNRIMKEKEIQENTNKIQQYKRWAEQEKELTILLTKREEEIRGLQEILDSVNTIEERKEKGWYFWDTGERIKKIKEEMIGYEKERAELRKKIENYLSLDTNKTEQEENKSFYQWLADILNKPSDKIEFFISIFPAVFIDIIAPLGMLVALRRKKEED